jgi:hypothetical protein
VDAFAGERFGGLTGEIVAAGDGTSTTDGAVDSDAMGAPDGLLSNFGDDVRGGEFAPDGLDDESNGVPDGAGDSDEGDALLDEHSADARMMDDSDGRALLDEAGDASYTRAPVGADGPSGARTATGGAGNGDMAPEDVGVGKNKAEVLALVVVKPIDGLEDVVGAVLVAGRDGTGNA